MLESRMNVFPVNLKGKVKGSKLVDRRGRSVHSHDVFTVGLVRSGNFSADVDVLGERKSEREVWVRKLDGVFVNIVRDLSFLDDFDIEFGVHFAVFLKVSVDFGRSLGFSRVEGFGKLRGVRRLHFGMRRGGLDFFIKNLLMVK